MDAGAIAEKFGSILGRLWYGLLRVHECDFRPVALALLGSFFALTAQAQYVPPYVELIGTLSSSNGMPAANYTMTFEPTQVMFVGGTSTVVADSRCATDSSGAVVGMGNPLTVPILAPVYTGTVPAGNYYVKVTWYDTYANQTLPSPEVMVQLTAPGSIQVSPPAGYAPSNALGMDVFIGSTSGSETYQGQTSSPTATFTQAVGLSLSGGTPPITNTSICQVVANDAAWPIAGYNWTVSDASGNTVPGFPMQVQFVGPGSAFNISQGFPLYNGKVTYPVPVLTTPYNHNAQSISGPLSMSGYNVYNVRALGVATAVPAYGVDVEGSTGPLAAINANQGYTVDGLAGTSGQCLASDGTYFDTPVSCITSLPTLYYQTVLNGSHATDAVTQRSYLAAGTGTGLFATDVVGAGTQVSRTVLNVNAIGGTVALATDPFVIVSALSSYPPAGHCMVFDAIGGAADGGVGCGPTSTWQDEYGSLTGCTFPNDGGGLSCAAGTITWPVAFSDTAYNVSCSTMYSTGIAGGSSTQPVIILNATISSVSAVSITEGVAQGSSGGFGVAPNYGLTILCHAHHD